MMAPALTIEGVGLRVEEPFSLSETSTNEGTCIEG